MNHAPAASKHSNSPPSEDEGEEDGDKDEDDGVVHRASKKVWGMGKLDEDVRIIGEKSAQHHKEDGKRATEGVNDAAAAKKAQTSSLSDDDVFYLFLQKQKIGAELHIYLEEGTYHKRLLQGSSRLSLCGQQDFSC